MAEELGDVAERLGHNAKALAAYSQSRRLAGTDSLAVARLLRKEGRVEERAGHYTASLRRLGRALRLLESLGDGRDVVATLVETRLACSVTRFFQGRFEESVALATKALAEAATIGDRRSIAEAHLQLEMACSELHRPQRADHARLALGLFEALDDDLGLGNLLLNIGVSEYNEGNWTRAVESYRRSSRHYREPATSSGRPARSTTRPRS